MVDWLGSMYGWRWNVNESLFALSGDEDKADIAIVWAMFGSRALFIHFQVYS